MELSMDTIMAMMTNAAIDLEYAHDLQVATNWYFRWHHYAHLDLGSNIKNADWNDLPPSNLLPFPDWPSPEAKYGSRQCLFRPIPKSNYYASF